MKPLPAPRYERECSIDPAFDADQIELVIALLSCDGLIYPTFLFEEGLSSDEKDVNLRLNAAKAMQKAVAEEKCWNWEKPSPPPLPIEEVNRMIRAAGLLRKQESVNLWE